ncbi:MCE family protein [Gordonia sp. PP30]|uniref:MCE family protein n=1 Tax=unclassified Gordonia (in: high G+C Gram-positive bacteria) TaxID=2657482 RepID=UPI0020003FE2|nr:MULTISPECIES: MCE family protein [unclassified Gordonia (in: high G+C Gram-positive bacteria)]UQE75609.1 MCE family protein [Gordonia sp. PP30]
MGATDRIAGLSFPKRVIAIIAVLLIAVLVVMLSWFGYQRVTTRTITAYFPSVTGLYSGDPVRVIGVPVGKVSSITPRKGDVKVVMRIDKDVPIPTDVRAVIVAQSLVSGRFVQLTPSYTTGPKLGGDANDIPMDRTAVPMEWDDVKKQLNELSEVLGPKSGENGTVDHGTAVKTIDTLAANLDGNGAAMATSLKEMSTVMGTLAENRDDLFATVKSLQKLTDLLSQNHQELVQFNGRMASVSSVLADSNESLGDAMDNLDEALGELRGFLDHNTAAVAATMQKMVPFTDTLKRNDEGLRGLLHSAPNQLANFMNMYNPLTGSLDGVFGLGMGNNLITLLCGSMASTARPMDDEAGVEKCVDLLAPILKDVAVNFPPFVANPLIGRAATQDQIQYQNPSVKARAQAGVADRDVASTKPQPADPMLKMLLPFGGN